MQLLAGILAGSVLATGCAATTYHIPASELQRLAAMPPETRGQHVRVVQQLSDGEVEPAQPVTAETEVVLFPEPNVWGPERRRWYGSGGASGGGGWSGGDVVRDHRAGVGGSSRPSSPAPHAATGHGGSLQLGSGSDGKAAAIAILAAAAVIVVAAAAVEGSRFDGYAELHPMYPLHVVGRDGSTAVMPLAWIDPQTAAWADHAVVREHEGPWHALERAPLDRQGWTYALLGGLGTYKSVDRTVDHGPAFAIQFGYFPDQKLGILGNVFFGWRNNAVNQTLFDTRYTLELDAYPVQADRLHLGVFGGGGLGYRVEDYPGSDGNEGTTALLGGALVQLDINTRLALTGRLGITYAHGEQMKDALFGLSVY
jgi:hypothetical protein